MKSFRINKKKIQKSFVKQHGEFLCGPACLASVIKYFGGDTNQDKLREICGTTLNGTTLLGLYQAAKQYGLKVAGYQAELKNLKEITVPVILPIVKDGFLEHFVVSYGFLDNTFIIGDPASGITNYSEEMLLSVWKSNALLKLEPGEKFSLKKQHIKDKICWILQQIRDDYPILGIAAFLGVLISIFGMALALFSQQLIDKILPDKNRYELIIGLIIFFLVLLIRILLNYIREIFLIRQSKKMNLRLIHGFFGKLIFLPQSFFDSTSTGDIIARMNDVRRIQRVVVNLSSQLIIDLLVVFGSAGYIFFISASTGFLCLMFIPVFGFLVWRYHPGIVAGQRNVMQSYSATESRLLDTITGIKAIRTFVCESLFVRHTMAVYTIFMNKVLCLGSLGARMNAWNSLAGIFMIIMVIGWSSHLVLMEQLTIGQMMAILTLTGSLGGSIESITSANIHFQEAHVAFDRMYEFTIAKGEGYTQIKHNQKNKLEIRNLKIQNLNFRFSGNGLLLKNINLELKKGETVALFGEIGCGKSTIISILQRFYPFETGNVTVNDNNWDKISNHDWRKIIASVEQKIKLFNGTIWENICLEEYPNPTKVIRFCQKYGFHSFFSESSKSYNTIIREGSSNISGGQQQLIALARALYSNPQVLLLDEATASMGRRSEQFVFDLIKQIKSKMAVLYVTHRPQLARQANRIYIIENKTISDFGTHRELLRKNAFYRSSFKECMD